MTVMKYDKPITSYLMAFSVLL